MTLTPAAHNRLMAMNQLMELIDTYKARVVARLNQTPVVVDVTSAANGRTLVYGNFGEIELRNGDVQPHRCMEVAIADLTDIRAVTAAGQNIYVQKASKA